MVVGGRGGGRPPLPPRRPAARWAVVRCDSSCVGAQRGPGAGSAKREFVELLHSFGWPAEHIVDLGDITAVWDGGLPPALAPAPGSPRHRLLRRRRRQIDTILP